MSLDNSRLDVEGRVRQVPPDGDRRGLSGLGMHSSRRQGSHIMDQLTFSGVGWSRNRVLSQGGSSAVPGEGSVGAQWYGAHPG